MQDGEPLKVLCPTWVRGEMDKLINGLDGRHADVMVGAVAVLGEQGFDTGAREQTHIFDPKIYGPVMLQGYNILAGAMLAKVLGHVHELLQSDQHFTQEIEDREERFEATRNVYEVAVREFLKQMLYFAGGNFQEQIRNRPKVEATDGAAISLVCGSKMIQQWMKIAESPFAFKKKPGDEPDEAQGHGGECGEDSGPAD